MSLIEGAIDTLLVAGTLDYTLAYTSTDLHSRLRRRAPQTRRVGRVAPALFSWRLTSSMTASKGYDDADIIIR